MISNIFKGKGVLLRVDEDGKDLFYPWGYPGQAFLLRPSQKKTLKLFLAALEALFLMVLLAIIVIDHNEIILKDYTYGLFSAAIMVVSSVYFAGIFFCAKHMSIREEPIVSLYKPSLALFTLTFVQIAAIVSIGFCESIPNVISIPYISVGVIYCSFIAYLFLRYFCKKGRFFTTERV